MVALSDAHLDLRARWFEPRRCEAAGLQHAQQLHLPGERQVADLVEEQGAAVGGLEACPRARLWRRCRRRHPAPNSSASISSAGSAPQLSVTNGPVAHRRVGLHDGRDALLAGAVRAGDQHRHVGARDLAGQVEHALGGRVGEHQAAQVVAALPAVAPRLPLAARPRASARLAWPSSSRLLTVASRRCVVPGLGEVVGRAGLHQLHRALEVGPRGEQDHRQVGVVARGWRRNSASPSSPEVVSALKFMSWITRSTRARCASSARPSAGEAARSVVDVVQREQHVQRGARPRGLSSMTRTHRHVGERRSSAAF